MAARRPRMAIRRNLCVLTAMLCGQIALGADAPATATEPLTRSVRGGPVELTVSLSRGTVQVAEPLTLTLTARAPQGVTVTLPQDPTSLGSFHVLQVRDTPDVPTGDGREWTRHYQLENLAPGKHTIPPISVAYVDGREATALSGLVASAPLEATVTSVLEGTPDPLKFRDIKDVVDLPEASGPALPAWVTWSLTGGSVLALAGVAILVWPTRDRQLSPHAWAETELARLEQDDLIARGEIQLFYFRLTDIVRQYIERQIGIAAPKLTTVEFLDQATRDESLSQPQQNLLRGILTLADYVKFARFAPQEAEARQAIDTTRQFIEQVTAEETP